MEIKDKKLINLLYKIFPEKIIHNHTYQVKRFIKSVADKYDKKGKKIIDIGAGTCPYKKYFRQSQYFSQDLKNNPQKTIDFVGNADSIPVKNNRFDYILCLQVLEHIKEPHLIFKEFHRILKPGGKLFLTTHMAFEEHMVPYDYFRFTRYGLKYFAETTGFKTIKIKPQGGRFIVLAREIQVLILRLVDNKYLILFLYFIFAIPLYLLSLVLFWLDFFDKKKALTLNHECIFQK